MPPLTILRTGASRLGLSALVVLTAGAPSEGAPGEWSVTSGSVAVVCPLTVGGSFEATTAALTGRLSADASQPGKLVGELAVDLTTLDSGIGLRNTHMRENYLEVNKGDPFRRAILKDIVLGGDPATMSGATTFTATLLVHGVERPVRGQARLSRQGNAVRVEASFPVVLADHGIAKPRYLGVGVRDEVQVKVRFQASGAGDATGSSR